MTYEEKYGVKKAKEIKEKIRLANIGQERSKAACEAMSKAQMGNQNSKGNCLSKKARKTISRKLTGRILSKKTRKKMSIARNARIISDEQRIKLSIVQGGDGDLERIDKEKNRQRDRCKIRKWRKKVYKRDNFKCIWCDKGGELNAHHIFPWAKFPNKQYDINNGATLCVDCHEDIRGLEIQFISYFQMVYKLAL